MIELKNWRTGAVLFRADVETVREAVEAAVKAGAVLTDADLTRADLRGAILRGAVLTGAILRGAVLTDAVLTGAVLTDADLTGADVPTIPDIHQAVAAAISAEGATLDMGHWHGAAGEFCGTTHCRAGWVTHLAGKAGKALDDKLGPAAAAALIYQASDPTLERVPNFYTTNEEARADIERLAAQEAKA